MNYREREKVYNLLITKNGTKYQVTKIIQELAELTKELTKVLMDEGNVSKIFDEIADVKIGVEQLENMYVEDAKAMDFIVDYKIKRTQMFVIT